MDLSDHAPLRSTEYDVIVVGGRAAGAATAMLLARQGVRTVVLDDTAPGSDTRSAHALMRGGVLQLARWGLLDDVVATGAPPIRRTSYRYGDRRVTVSVKPSLGVDALYAPRRTTLDPLLVRAARGAGARVHHRTAVTDLVQRGGRVVGVRTDGPDGPVELRAAVVVGADGVHSTVARRAGADLTAVGRNISATTYGYWRGLDLDGYELVFHPDASSGFVPTERGDTCVFVNATPARIGDGGVDVIRDLVAEGAPDLAALLVSRPHGIRSWFGHPGYLRRSHGPGWALVGDAGCFTDPIGLQGLTHALRDAELLASALVEGFDSSMDDALAGYERERDRLSRPVLEIVDRIAGHDWDDVSIEQLRLELSSASADEVEAIAAFGASS